MRAIILIVAAIALAIWSLFAWAVYVLLGFAGDLAAGGAFMVPFVPPELVYWTAQILGGMGGVFVWVVWAIGAAIIAVLALIPLAMARRRPRRYDGGPGPYGSDQRHIEADFRRHDGPPPRRDFGRRS